jgi:hypothetical protein
MAPLPGGKVNLTCEVVVMSFKSLLAVLAASSLALFATALIAPAEAMGPVGPSAASKAENSLVQTVGHRRHYRSRAYYYPRHRHRHRYYAYGPSYYSYGPSYYYGGPYYRPYYGSYYGGYPYYGRRFYGGGFGFYGPRFGLRIGW